MRLRVYMCTRVRWHACYVMYATHSQRAVHPTELQLLA